MSWVKWMQNVWNYFIRRREVAQSEEAPKMSGASLKGLANALLIILYLVGPAPNIAFVRCFSDSIISFSFTLLRLSWTFLLERSKERFKTMLSILSFSYCEFLKHFCPSQEGKKTGSLLTYICRVRTDFVMTSVSASSNLAYPSSFMTDVRRDT